MLARGTQRMRPGREPVKMNESSPVVGRIRGVKRVADRAEDNGTEPCSQELITEEGEMPTTEALEQSVLR